MSKEIKSEARKTISGNSTYLTYFSDFKVFKEYMTSNVGEINDQNTANAFRQFQTSIRMESNQDKAFIDKIPKLASECMVNNCSELKNVMFKYAL